MRFIRYNPSLAYSYAAATRGYNRSTWSGLEHEIDRLFSTSRGDFGGAASSQIPVDLYEDKTNAYVRAELPGVNRDDIQVELVDGTLTLNATRKTKDGNNEQSFAVNRAVNIPESVQVDQVSAVYENGVLTVTLPKRAETKPNKITVAVK